ncbi:hypothetical protein LJR030_004430 [Rhizobium sp. LjRoot30]|uniref:hypothetical protein n=1 Tax=Rhizobium sp. LjRoot30 TaxID=3342320 RepID=UPI003ECD42AD
MSEGDVTIPWVAILLAGVVVAVLARLTIGGRFIGHLSKTLPGAAMGCLLAEWLEMSLLQLVPGFDFPFLAQVLHAAIGAYGLMLISIVARRRRL